MKQPILPLLDSLSDYNKTTFRADLQAGLTVAVMLVPQGMAYAMLAGMPPIYGLYGGLIPLVLYALFGTSRQMSIGPVAVSALLVLAGVSQLAEPGTASYIELVILAGLLIGGVQVVLSLLRMGIFANFLSHPVIAGFTSAAAIIIAISQLKDLLGFPIPRFEHSIDTLLYAIQHLDQTNWIAVVVCVSSIILILILKKWKPAFPGALLVVVLATVLTYLLRLDQQGLAIVQNVPEGLPAFQMPSLQWKQIVALVPTVLTVSIIGIVESLSIAKVLESKHQSYVVRPNQELLALGISKMGGAFFQALPTSGSFTRSAVNNDAGAKTGIASIITAILIGLTLLLLTPLFYYLPKAVLAAIILLAVKSLFEIEEAIDLWHTHRQDFMMMLITFVVTLVVSIEQGVLAGVVMSLLMVFYRSAKPNIAVLGKLPDSTSYRNIHRFGEADQPKEVLIVRFDDQLYFVNATYFKDAIKSLITDKTSYLKCLVLDASSIHEIDSSGLHALEEIYSYLQKHDIDLYLSGVIGPVRDVLHKSGLMEKIGLENQFLKIHDAIEHFETKHDTAQETKGWSDKAIQTNISK